MLLPNVNECVSATRRLLEAGDVRSLRYAALEMRMAIEQLFYALLPHYRDELPDDIVKQWQPRQIIDALIDCNPFIESHQQITIGPSGGGGGEPIFKGTYKPVTRKLLRQYYHRLGSYLHASPDGSLINEAKLRATIAGALERVDEHCRETTVIANVGVFITVNCVCGREIRRNFLALSVNQSVRCPDPRCGAIFDLVAMGAPMQTTWSLRRQPYLCPSCNGETPIGQHEIRAGAQITCEKCQAAAVLRVGFVPVLVEQPLTKRGS
jgi:hypothetical protein